MRTLDKIITKVDSRYGAPMGRIDKGSRWEAEDQGKRIYDCEVQLSSGGYDKGGAYWGLGRALRVSYTKDLSFVEFYRRS